MTQTTTKDNLISAALRLAAMRGVDGASVRQIAREAGVTEGALYRHFKNKDALWREIYSRIVRDMIREKEELLERPLSARERVGEWVRLTYAYYDANADAFTYVLLMPSRVAEHLGEVYTEQGRLFTRLIRGAQESGEVRRMDPILALSHFSGLMLNVPRLINEGALDGPASQYVDDVARTVWAALRAD